ncbi:MAG: long-chain fatty acid--CoA ligase [Bdellovibrionales bacterium]|jgi:long-chain acyl-CoA synthetase|nr:long-chain fatty acid--CoA ligase [Bdellovibrionales bacterium]
MADTIVRRFIDTAKRHPTKTAVRFPQATNSRNINWLELNWTEYRQLVDSLAAGLQAQGVRKGDRVAILANTRLEWAALDLAILGLGAVTVPIYPSSTQDDVSFILHDSHAKILFVEDLTVLRKLSSVFSRDSKLRRPEKVVLIEAAPASEIPTSGMTLTATTSLDELQVMGSHALKASPALFEMAIDEVRIDDVATIIYTSGTTGRPKGVVHTHAQAFSEVAEAFPLLGVSSSDVTLTFLPFAHVLGRIEIWGHALLGFTMGYAVSIDRLKSDFQEIRPTIIVAVPRVFEKIHAGILSQAEISPMRRKVFDWALSVGREVSVCKQEKRAIPLETAIQYAGARKLVFDSIQERLGGRLRFAVCGGAPLSREIAEFFHAAGLLILEGYGLTETTAAVCVNTPFDYRFGTVGKPIGDVKIQIADDGEILVKSKKVMREYLGDPEGTAAVLKDGWFRTGDIGEFDEQGHLRITDRKKDLIKTAGGKYVAPQRLEGLVKLSHYISNVHIHGDNRKFCVALVTLATDSISTWAKDNGVETGLPADTAKHPKVRELIRRAIADANAQLASFETIKNFAILDADFTVESGELTPSLKVKRKVVDERYRELIESLY